MMARHSSVLWLKWPKHSWCFQIYFCFIDFSAFVYFIFPIIWLFVVYCTTCWLALSWRAWHNTEVFCDKIKFYFTLAGTTTNLLVITTSYDTSIFHVLWTPISDCSVWRDEISHFYTHVTNNLYFFGTIWSKYM